MRRLDVLLRRWMTAAVSACVLAGPAMALADSPADADGLPKLTAREEKFRDERVKVVQKGSSAKASRTAALQQLPLDRLGASQRAKADAVLGSISLYRELPTVTFEAEPEVYRFFLNAPEVAVGIWKAMGISKFSMTQRSANEYDADCGDGTSGVIEILHRGENRCLIWCDGAFKGPLMLRPIRSQCLLAMDWTFERTRDNRPLVKHRAQLFVTFPSQTVEAAARVVAPISSHVIDHNFREISLFLHMMSQVMQKQPGWVERTAAKMDDVLDSRKQQLLKLSAQVYVAHRKHNLKKQGDEDVSIDEVLTPTRQASGRSDVTPASDESLERPAGTNLFPREPRTRGQ